MAGLVTYNTAAVCLMYTVPYILTHKHTVLVSAVAYSATNFLLPMSAKAIEPIVSAELSFYFLYN